MDSSREQGELTFTDYLRPVWRFKFVVLLIVVVASAATYVYTRRQAKVYQASTALYVGQSELQQLLNPTQVQTPRSLEDEAALVTSPQVADAVSRNLKLGSQGEALLGSVQATASPTSDFIGITAQTGNPRLTADIANGFAHAFIAQRTNNLVRNARVTLVQLQRQLAAVPKGTSAALTRQALRTQIGTVESEIASPPSQGQVIAPAAVPGVPTSPKPTRNAIFAAVIAFVLGLIGSYLFDRSDRRVRRLEDVETLFDLPVLATIPYVRGLGRTPKDGLDVPSEAREPLRTLRVNLDLARARIPAQGSVILVTSALPEEGKSTIVRNLAISYCEAGMRVAVVEADMRRPVLAKQFGLEPAPGLSDALSGERAVPLQQVTDNDRNESLHGSIDVAVAGTAHSDPTVLLASERMATLLAELSDKHDIVLVDTPPLLSVSDGLPLLSIVDGVMVVVRVGRTTYPAAARLRQSIERFRGAEVLGIAVNSFVDELSTYSSTYTRRNGADSSVAQPTGDISSA